MRLGLLTKVVLRCSVPFFDEAAKNTVLVTANSERMKIQTLGPYHVYVYTSS